ncbi:hypothetical protein KOR42_40490 [Thalassoglobus neptunius]|uniref:Uncharacterized protein n=1 Tax=Thalassoglobus neptunius TaxID=1938619 RepID=A0A5C5WD05_9PLAN|nr:hypothetical protein KOR42_40490 [Thalassoglobus neptunius]
MDRHLHHSCEVDELSFRGRTNQERPETPKAMQQAQEHFQFWFALTHEQSQRLT